MPGYFEKKYGIGKFEVVEIPDLAVEGSLDEAVKGTSQNTRPVAPSKRLTVRVSTGCDAIAHLAANLTFSPDPTTVIPDALAFTRNTLSAALAEPRIQRFVFCSWAAAVHQYRFNEPFDLTPSTWNTTDPAIAWAPPPYTSSRTMCVYATSKVEAEQFFWTFMRERKPYFVGNAVLPDMGIGMPVNGERQGLGPAGRLMQSLWEGGEVWRGFPPQLCVDVRDVALLHVAGLVKGDVNGERLFGFAGNWNWGDILGLVGGWYPGMGWSGEFLRPSNDSSREDCLGSVHC